LASAITASSFAESWLEDHLGATRAFYVQSALILLAAVVAAAIGVFGDLVKVALVRDVTESDLPLASFSTRFRRAFSLAFHAIRIYPSTTFGAWGWRTALSALLVALGAIALGETSLQGGAALGAVVLVHQAIGGVRLALRASWLARALRLVAR
jgi:hypothetical protein